MPNASYGFEVYNSIRQVNPDEWNSLREPHDLFMDHRFIESVEDSMKRESRFRHVVVRDSQGRPMAIACLSSFSIGGATLAKGTLGKILAGIEKVAPWLVRSKLILCGLPVSAGQSHVRFAPEADREAALRIIDKVARKFARKEWARLIVFKEIDPDGCRDLAPLVSIGYRQADSYPVNVALSKFRDLEDYFTHVHWKRRGKLRRSRRIFEKSGLRIVDRLGSEGAAELYTDDVHRLYTAVADKSEVEFGYLPADFFRELARRLPDNTIYTYVYQGDKVVGFMASLFNETSIHGLFAGLDYSLNSECELYFNLLFHFFDIALKRKSPTFSWGRRPTS